MYAYEYFRRRVVVLTSVNRATVSRSIVQVPVPVPLPVSCTVCHTWYKYTIQVVETRNFETILQSICCRALSGTHGGGWWQLSRVTNDSSTIFFRDDKVLQ